MDVGYSSVHSRYMDQLLTLSRQESRCGRAHPSHPGAGTLVSHPTYCMEHLRFFDVQLGAYEALVTRLPKIKPRRRDCSTLDCGLLAWGFPGVPLSLQDSRGGYKELLLQRAPLVYAKYKCHPGERDR